MASRRVNLHPSLCLLLCGLSILTWSQKVVCVDPRKSNVDSESKSFFSWVRKVQVNHTAHVLAGTATLAYHESLDSQLAAANTFTVGGGGAYSTVQSAVNAAPGGTRVTIVINGPGPYREKIRVPKGKIITFQGVNSPVLVWGDTAGSSGSTENSASTTILADDFIATGVVFQNSAPAPADGAVGAQAVALRISGDRGAFYSCKFYGAQDTLYDHAGRHYFKNCFIQGSIDFIFGDGQSLYQSCNLNSIAKAGSGSLTAQKRTGNENTGFSFVGCSITGSGPIYLGRAWGPNSRVVFIQCNIANIITPTGWYDWGDSSRQNTVFYGQYQCSGPGANEAGRVGWSHELTASQAAPFSSLSFIDGSSWVTS